MRFFACGCIRHMHDGVLSQWKVVCESHRLAVLGAIRRRAWGKDTKEL